MKSINQNVQTFLNSLKENDAESLGIVNEVRKLIFQNHPASIEKFMYGGIIFSLDSDDFSGVFARKNHVSLEFGNGFSMDDPKKLLEGGGKYRRHLKIRSEEEIASLKVSYFLEQAI